MTDWRSRAAALAKQLTTAGALRNPLWRKVFGAVPRHTLMPHHYAQGNDRRWREADTSTTEGKAAWLDAVYADRIVITAAIRNEDGNLVPVSTSSKPSLMARMLEALELDNGHRVLEIGTGTGYNAALLSHRLGAGNVYSVDLRPDLIEHAQRRLRQLGYHPTLVACDGRLGLAEYAPYDRIIVTCSVPTVPVAWIDQLRPGGLLLVDIEGSLNAGNLALLRRPNTAATLHGQYLPWWGRFMPMRHAVDDAGYHHRRPERDTTSPAVADTTRLDPAELDEGFRLLAQLHLPPGTFHGLTADSAEAEQPTHTNLIGPDGSWCDIARMSDANGSHQLTKGGSDDLWNKVEHAHRQWLEFGEPEWHRFGLTITTTHTTTWLDRPQHHIRTTAHADA